MASNSQDPKKILLQTIIYMQKQLLELRQAVAQAIAAQQVIPQTSSARQVAALKQNLFALETKIAQAQAQYHNWGDDLPPLGGIAPSPRPKNPTPTTSDGNDAATLPEQ